ncbi:hypothetical protein A4A49_34416 [Nicotiana attenuata]|uniref:Uncharacterized protein n=1 Tax=Nicotiana attenuata TaxID=49451 RepID=A0A1J6I4P7_NICAT|nr:hypothetical protein A4A49_34416 [Nicotiana attenuata]
MQIPPQAKNLVEEPVPLMVTTTSLPPSHLLDGNGIAGRSLSTDPLNRVSANHYSNPEPSLLSQGSHCMPQSCNVEPWASTVAGNLGTSTRSTQPTNNDTKPAECTVGPDQPLLAPLPPSDTRGGDCKPLILPMDTKWTKTPLSRETQMAGSEKVHEHLQASNTELEVLIAKLGVLKKGNAPTT